MLKAVAPGLSILFLLICVSATDNGFPRCNCDDENSLWTIERILECQRVSDLLIAVAYFSIPIELLCFISCASVPFKWVLIQFIAFIVLCGLTHLLNTWTYGPHSFQLMVALTIFKTLTALVSCATAITLMTLIPLLLKVKVRELMLKKKTCDLGREVKIIMRQKEAAIHVRMLTQEIRKSLDRHTILYTTLVELSKTLGLQNCAVWMPNVDKTEVNLTHELNGRNINFSIPITHPDIIRIKKSDEINTLSPDSALAAASSGISSEAGPVAAIRMPMLRVCNFKGGTPELMEACYAILVLILPSGEPRSWSDQELEIIEAVADQVAVALSHAAILEESQLMREKLEEQNRALQQAKRNALTASQARNLSQKVMSDGMRRPMHSILGLLSIIHEENLKSEQKLIVDAMLRTSNVLSNWINDAMNISAKDDGRIPLEMRSFGLHAIIKEAACFAKCLCVYKGFGFMIEFEKSLPDNVMGDESRLFQVILHMVGNLLDGNHRGGILVLRVFAERGSQGGNDHGWTTWRPSSSSGNVHIRFEIAINSCDSELGSSLCLGHGGMKYSSNRVEVRLRFSICKTIVQLMQGKIWFVPNTLGFPQTMVLVLPFQLRPSIAISISEPGESSERADSSSLLRGLQVLLADNDDVNRAVTQKLLRKLGCVVTSVCSGFECIAAIGPAGSSIQVILLDLHMPELDGFEVATRIRKLRSRNGPMIVALTTTLDEDLWERCMQVRIDGVLRKPLVLQGITSELQRILMQGNKIL